MKSNFCTKQKGKWVETVRERFTDIENWPRRHYLSNRSFKKRRNRKCKELKKKNQRKIGEKISQNRKKDKTLQNKMAVNVVNCPVRPTCTHHLMKCQISKDSEIIIA